MKKISQMTEIVGTLYLENGLSYDLLDLNPQKRTDLARIFIGEPAFSFYVVSRRVAKTITIVRSGFVIEPNVPTFEQEVVYYVEEEASEILKPEVLEKILQP